MEVKQISLLERRAIKKYCSNGKSGPASAIVVGGIHNNRVTSEAGFINGGNKVVFPICVIITLFSSIGLALMCSFIEDETEGDGWCT